MFKRYSPNIPVKARQYRFFVLFDHFYPYQNSLPVLYIQDNFNPLLQIL